MVKKWIEKWIEKKCIEKSNNPPPPNLSFEKLNTPHVIIVEDKTIKCLVTSLIEKINKNCNISQNKENKDFDDVKDNKEGLPCCCIGTLKNGKSQIKSIPTISEFQSLKSLLLVVDNDAKEEVKNFYKKFKEEQNKQKNEQRELSYSHIRCCLIPSKSEDGDEIEDYIYSKLKNSDKKKFETIKNFIRSFFKKPFPCIIRLPCIIRRMNKRILNILVYIESRNLNDLEKAKCKYIKNIINNIDEKEAVFVRLKSFFDKIKNNHS